MTITHISRRFESLDDAFHWIVEAIVREGESVAPRSIATKELRSVSVSIEDARRRYVSLVPRRWSLAYALGEFCWHARGSSSVDEISFYSTRWREMSEDGISICGSNYGAKIFANRGALGSQWNAVQAALTSDTSSRRGVLYFADALGDVTARSRDTSCATSLQFLVRDGKLEAIATMRSNDAMIGLPYDIFLFTMLQELMAVSLRLELGSYHHFAGSMHIYDSDLDAARAIVDAAPTVRESMPPMTSISGLAHFLKGEQQTRGGLPIEYSSSHEDRYWTDLLAVLEYRNGLRLGKLLRLEDTVKDPLYRELTRLRIA